MVTLQITQIADLRPGDRIVRHGGRDLIHPHIVLEVPGPDHARLEHPDPETMIEWWLYPEAAEVGMTIERGVSEPEPPEPEVLRPDWDRRERGALYRNPNYLHALRWLAEQPEGTARLPKGKLYSSDTWERGHTFGIIGAFYGWVEKLAPRHWRITTRGRQVLAAAERSENLKTKAYRDGPRDTWRA